MKLNKNKLKWYHDEISFISLNSQAMNIEFLTSMDSVMKTSLRTPPFADMSYSINLIPSLESYQTSRQNLCNYLDKNCQVLSSSFGVSNHIGQKPDPFENISLCNSLMNQYTFTNLNEHIENAKSSQVCCDLKFEADAVLEDFPSMEKNTSRTVSPIKRLASLVGPRRRDMGLLHPIWLQTVTYNPSILESTGYISQTSTLERSPQESPIDQEIGIKHFSIINSTLEKSTLSEEKNPQSLSVENSGKYDFTDCFKLGHSETQTNVTFEKYSSFPFLMESHDNLFNEMLSSEDERILPTTASNASFVDEITDVQGCYHTTKRMNSYKNCKEASMDPRIGRDQLQGVECHQHFNTELKDYVFSTNGAERNITQAKSCSESFELKYHLSTQCGISSLSSSLSDTSLSKDSSQGQQFYTAFKNTFERESFPCTELLAENLAVSHTNLESPDTRLSAQLYVSDGGAELLKKSNELEADYSTWLFFSGDIFCTETEFADMLSYYKSSIMLVKELGLCLSFALNPVELHFLPSISHEAHLNQKKLGLKKINEGTFSTIYKARYGLEHVAVKCPLHNYKISDALMMYMRSKREWRILGKFCGHPNILKLIGGIVVSPYDIWIITEYIDGGDLYTRLYSQDPRYLLSPSQRLSVIRQIAFAVSTLHSAKPYIVHKDLKVNNILLTWDNTVRLCDFGDAEEISEGGELGPYTAVTWQYASPEIIFSDDPRQPVHGASEKVDIWSLGCIFLELCYKTTPFWSLLATLNPSEHKSALQKHLNENYAMTELSSQRIKTNLPFHLSHLTEGCLSFDPELRPSATQIYGYITQHECELYEEILQVYEGSY